MGLSAAMGERITIERGAIVQTNFPDYPILTLAQTPLRVDVHFVRTAAPGWPRRTWPAAGGARIGERALRGNWYAFQNAPARTPQLS